MVWLSGRFGVAGLVGLVGWRGAGLVYVDFVGFAGLAFRVWTSKQVKEKNVPSLVGRRFCFLEVH